MISIIVPVYKVEPYLRQCVDSILAQTYWDIEVLLIDDGSPDHCGEMCDEYGRQDARVRVFHTENRGLSAARNLGISEARGEYIGFVDSDDWIEPDMYEVLLRRMQETGADIGVCGLWYERKNTREVAKDVIDAGFTDEEPIKALILNHLKNYAWNKLYDRKLWNDVSFPEGHVFEDVATTYKAILNAEKVVSCSKPLYHYRQREDSIGSSHSMDNLLDYWDAYYGRYEALVDAETITGQAIAEKLEEQIANAALRIWRWIWVIPVTERDEKRVKTISTFIRNNYPHFGINGWRAYLRSGIFLVRYANSVSYAIAYCMNWFYRCLGLGRNYD